MAIERLPGGAFDCFDCYYRNLFRFHIQQYVFHRQKHTSTSALSIHTNRPATMPSSKTDTALRFPENDDQTRRLRNVTQDRKAVSRMQNESSTSDRKAENKATWGPEQLLGINMNEGGNPEPDPASRADGSKATRSKKEEAEEPDIYGAMTEDFD